MLITIILAVIMMAGLFLLLWSGIALIQDKRYFTSAPKEIQDAVQPREERFPHAHALGFFLVGCAFILMIAPIGLSVAKQLKISPIEMLICISVSSNLQGAATLVGDTTSIMLGGYADMNFFEFFWMNGKPSIFCRATLLSILRSWLSTS